MQKTTLLRTILLTSTLPLAALTACGSSDSDAGSDGDDAAERTLTVYTGRNETLLEPIVDAFEEVTDIDVEVRYGDSAELGAQILEEGDATPAQVFLSQEVGAVGLLEDAGLLAELPADVLDDVDERYRPDEGGAWVGVTGRVRVLVHASDVADDLPASVLDLTDPPYEGKVGWAPTNASFQSFVTAMRVAEGEDVAEQWLTDMADNGTVAYENNVEILDAINAGELDYGLINHYYWVRNEVETDGGQDAELHFFEGDDVGSLVNATAAAITTTGADSPEAQEFVEFLLSPEAQELFVEGAQEYPLVAGVSQPAGVPPLEELGGPDLDLSDLRSLAETQELLAEVGLLT